MQIFDRVIEDKRRYKRVECKLPLQYRNLKKSGELPLGALTHNISEGGVSFRSSEFISLACRLVIEITIPTIAKPVKAISKIAWIRKLPTGMHYELGNQFLDMTKEDRAYIVDFVNNSTNSTK